MNTPEDLTPTEFELYNYTKLEFASSMIDVVSAIEKAIALQETDHGDWLRAKEWRDVKDSLISKLRRQHIKLV